MTAVSQKPVWLQMQAMLQAFDGVSNVMIGEPRSAVQTKMVCIIPDHGEIPESTLTSPREIHRLIVRMYRGWLEQPEQDVEFDLDQFRASIQADVFGDFTLGGTVAYALPGDFAWLYDVKTVEHQIWRTVDLLVAYMIDDNATYAT